MSEKRESERRRRTVIGSREGSKEGDGDGGGDKAKGGAGFAFGQMVEKNKVSEDVSQGHKANLKSGSSSLSYRDKLLSPGCAGFLMKHSEEDDIMKGWKDYFHRMNEKDVGGVSEGTEEDDDKTEGRLEGRTGVLKFTAEEYTTWCLPWRNSLTIKVLGASFPTYLIRDRINHHYLIVQRWQPNFNPWKVDLQCHIATWIRLPDVPFEFYNVESLCRIGNMIGKMIKVDRTTSIYDKGGFAHICVEIDLQQPLHPSYTVFGEERPIIYEGLHQVCFTCGRYSHQKDNCPTKKDEDQPNTQQNMEFESEGSSGVKGMESELGGSSGVKVMESELGGSSGVKGMESDLGGSSGVKGMESDLGGSSGVKVTKETEILQRESRRPSYAAGLRHDINGDLNHISVKKEKADTRDHQQLATKKDIKLGVNNNKKELTKDHDPHKYEWVQVGAKSKLANKGKFKGKESKAHDSRGAHGATSIQGNYFGILQTVDSNPHQAEIVDCTVGISQQLGGPDADVTDSHAMPLALTSSQVDPIAMSPQTKDVISTQQVNRDEQICTHQMTQARAQLMGFPNMEIMDCEGYSGGI
ncbi:hypothetical protein K1719_003838 [Acacia pycnantha]|nr:hypothetical protein K1719_003838 [Acacia pycnantha]